MSNLSLRSQPEYYQSHANIKEILAEALAKGRLRLVLGAGVSLGCGLPNWQELVEGLRITYNIESVGRNLTEISQELFRKGAQNDRLRFAEDVRKVLYKNHSNDLTTLSKQPLMIALGAISMAGVRSGAAEIISFNFDDLLEVYLRYHGFVVSSVATQPCLNSKCDVEILHLHGLLPSDLTKEVKQSIIFTESDFIAVLSPDSQNYWRERVTHILRSNICIFIGLSGDDNNLLSMLNSVSRCHPVLESDCYWGFRLCSRLNDPRNDTFKDYGVLPVVVNRAEIASWLLDVAQKSADLY